MIDRLSARLRPEGSASGSQRWRELLFLHWAVRPERLSSLLPSGLTLDLFEGQALVGIVPFRMEGVKPRWSPELLAFNFLETNLRTYVIRDGEPGVYFFSLEAASRIAVWVARLGWSLPYFYAEMSLTGPDQRRIYKTQRPHSSEPDLNVEYRIGEPLPAPEPASLDFFLLERYLLFTERRGLLWRGQVHHTPYPICEVEILSVTQGLSDHSQLIFEETLPLYTHYSPGVDVEVFALTPC